MSEVPHLQGLNVGIVCHDAGGGALIMRLAKFYNWRVSACLQGPALELFVHSDLKFKLTSLEALLDNSDVLVTGTGWGSDLEFTAILLGRKAGIHTITVFDHWLNFEARLTRNGNVAVPHEIWVTDELAESIASGIFPAIPIKSLPDPRDLELQQILSNCQFHAEKGVDLRLLILSEPIRDHQQSISEDRVVLGYDEFDSMEFLRSNIDSVHPSISEITLRPHPAEGPLKYQQQLALDWGRPINLCHEESILASISSHDIVVGCETSGMVLALRLQKRVISIIPFGGLPCRLPHPSIESLTNLVLRTSGCRNQDPLNPISNLPE